MTFNLSELKSISNNAFSSILTSAAETTAGGSKDYWKPTVDKNGNALAVVRLLPSLQADKLPWVMTQRYFVRNKFGGKNYFEYSRRMIDQPDPMAEYIRERWKCAVTESQKNEIKNEGLRLAVKYRVCALVINDQNAPENNGRVVLFEFGKVIYDKIIEKAKPVFANEESQNVFDWMRGCNLKMNVYMVGEFPRYDRCNFDNPSAIPDEKIEHIASEIERLDLYSALNVDNFKSYETLKAEVEEYKASKEAFEHGTVRSTAAKPTPINSATQTNAFGTFQAPSVNSSAKSEPNDVWNTTSSSVSSIDDLDFNKLVSESSY